MKKTIMLTLLALSLVACQGKDLNDPSVKDTLKQKETAENIEENQDNYQNDADYEGKEDQEIKRTYPEDENKNIEKEVIAVDKAKDNSTDNDEKKEEKSSDKDLKKDKKAKKDKKRKDKKYKKDEKNSEEKSADKNNEKKALTENDYFFSYYSLVTVRDGEVINPIRDQENYDDNYYVDYVPYSNNIFVLGSSNDNNKSDFSIRKINGQDLILLYDFNDYEEFRPKGTVGDKIYGIYHDISEATVGNGEMQSGIAYLDLGTGKINIFEDTKYKNENICQVAVTDKEILFTKFNRDQGTDLYRLDLEKGLDQKAEILEKDTDLNFLFSAKHFKNGKAEYEIFKSSDGSLKIKDVEYIINDGTRFIGENMINSSPAKFDDADYLFKMDIINYLTGEVVEKDLETYGYRVYKGKLYYIDYDKKVQSLEIGL